MRDRIDRLEQAERDLERVEAQRDQLREALVYVADFSGCEYSRNTARAALDATKEDSP